MNPLLMHYPWDIVWPNKPHPPEKKQIKSNIINFAQRTYIILSIFFTWRGRSRSGAVDPLRLQLMMMDYEVSEMTVSFILKYSSHNNSHCHCHCIAACLYSKIISWGRFSTDQAHSPLAPFPLFTFHTYNIPGKRTWADHFEKKWPVHVKIGQLKSVGLV